MSNAKVHSIEAIQSFAQRLQMFRLALVKELEALDLELRRVSHWIQDVAPSYWQQEQQTNARKLEEHLQQLSRCMSYVRNDEQRPCTEEKKRVARAKERAQLCETKIRTAQAAALHWESRLGKIATKLQRCQDMADAELQVAVSHLTRHLELLDSYTQLRSDGLRSTGIQSKSITAQQVDNDSANQNLVSETALTEHSQIAEHAQNAENGRISEHGGRPTLNSAGATETCSLPSKDQESP